MADTDGKPEISGNLSDSKDVNGPTEHEDPKPDPDPQPDPQPDPSPRPEGTPSWADALMRKVESLESVVDSLKPAPDSKPAGRPWLDWGSKR